MTNPWIEHIKNKMIELKIPSFACALSDERVKNSYKKKDKINKKELEKQSRDEYDKVFAYNIQILRKGNQEELKNEIELARARFKRKPEERKNDIKNKFPNTYLYLTNPDEYFKKNSNQEQPKKEVIKEENKKQDKEKLRIDQEKKKQIRNERTRKMLKEKFRIERLDKELKKKGEEELLLLKKELNNKKEVVKKEQPKKEVVKKEQLKKDKNVDIVNNLIDDVKKTLIYNHYSNYNRELYNKEYDINEYNEDNLKKNMENYNKQKDKFNNPLFNNLRSQYFSSVILDNKGFIKDLPKKIDKNYIFDTIDNKLLKLRVRIADEVNDVYKKMKKGTRINNKLITNKSKELQNEIDDIIKNAKLNNMIPKDKENYINIRYNDVFMKLLDDARYKKDVISGYGYKK